VQFPVDPGTTHVLLSGEDVIVIFVVVTEPVPDTASVAVPLLFAVTEVMEGGSGVA
jgi:hypothetical protein